MTFALISNVIKQSTNGNGATSAAISTTGALLFTAAMSDSDGSSTISDSVNGTTGWTKVRTDSSGPSSSLWYLAAPGTSGTQTFSSVCTGKFPTLCVQAWGDGHATPLDQQNGAFASSSTLQPGSITPAEADELLITGLAWDVGSGVLSINGGFTISDQAPIAGGAAYGGGMAYLVQIAAAAANPTWTTTVSAGSMRASIASFKKAAAGGGSTQPPRSMHRFRLARQFRRERGLYLPEGHERRVWTPGVTLKEAA